MEPLTTIACALITALASIQIAKIKKGARREAATTTTSTPTNPSTQPNQPAGRNALVCALQAVLNVAMLACLVFRRAPLTRVEVFFIATFTVFAVLFAAMSAIWVSDWRNAR